MNCRKAEPLLTALLLGELPPEQADHLQQHLASCESCGKIHKELAEALNLVQSALAAQAAQEPRLDEWRHDRLMREALYSHPLRHSPWRLVAKIAAALALAAGISALLLPRLYRRHIPVAAGRDRGVERTLLVSIQKTEPDTEYPAPPMEEFAPHPLPQPSPQPAAMPMQYPRLSGSDAAQGGKAVAVQTAAGEPERAEPTAIMPAASPPVLGMAKARSRADRETPDQAASSDRRGQFDAKLEFAADDMREAPEGAVSKPQPPPAPKKPPPPKPVPKKQIALFQPETKSNTIALANSFFANNTWPPAKQLRVEQFLDAMDFSLPVPARRSGTIQTEVASSPFRPDLFLLMVHIPADAFNSTNDVELSKTSFKIMLNKERVKKCRLLGYDHLPLQGQIPPEIIVETRTVRPRKDSILLLELELQGNAELSPGAIHFTAPASGGSEPVESVLSITRAPARFSPTRASPGFRLAAAVAELAELLRAAPPDEPKAMDSVARLLQRAALDFSANPRIREIANLAEAARAFIIQNNKPTPD